MEQLVSRTLKPLIEAVLVFIAVHYLTGSTAPAIGIGLIPLALGWLSIGTALGAAITVVTVVAALCWYAVPPDFKSVVHSQTRDAMSENAPGSPNEAAKPGHDQFKNADSAPAADKSP